VAGVVEGSDDALYGTTSFAGANGQGTIYRFSEGGLRTLYSFSGADGSAPSILVAAKNGSFYGITTAGSGGKGTVFAFNASGSLTTLYNFTGQADGGTPSSLILMADGNLYGATSTGGGTDGGTVFQLTPGGGLTTLIQFLGFHFGKWTGEPGRRKRPALWHHRRRGAVRGRDYLRVDSNWRAAQLVYVFLLAERELRRRWAHRTGERSRRQLLWHNGCGRHAWL